MTQFKTIDDRWKISTTDTHVYFVGSPFSQWWKNEFVGKLINSVDPGMVRASMVFNCAEQYMMASKAALFNDWDTFEEIMKCKEPSAQKALGRKVKNFDPAKWSSVAKHAVTAGNLFKFAQDEDLQKLLLATGDKTIVEGAWYDPVWGVKLAWNDPLILDEANWQGTNWLGECLMITRQKILDSVMSRVRKY